MPLPRDVQVLAGIFAVSGTVHLVKPELYEPIMPTRLPAHRELILGSTRFNDIARGLPGISRSLLVKRLQHLERCGVIDRWPDPTGNGHEYVLTPAGRDLEPVVMALGRWAIEWLYDELRPQAIDPVTLTWWMHHRIDGDGDHLGARVGEHGVADALLDEEVGLLGAELVDPRAPVDVVPVALAHAQGVEEAEVAAVAALEEALDDAVDDRQRHEVGPAGAGHVEQAEAEGEWCVACPGGRRLWSAVQRNGGPIGATEEIDAGKREREMEDGREGRTARRAS